MQSVQQSNGNIESITSGLQQHFVNMLRKQSIQGAETIANYVIAITMEVNPSIQHKSSQIVTLCYISNFHKQKPFTRDDVLEYLNSHRKPEESDPLHKWIGTYNLRRIYLLRFFKWLYYPEMEPSKRPIPDVVKNIPSFKRKEQSIYKPTDLWTEQDDALFLKYCPNKRDRHSALTQKSAILKEHVLRQHAGWSGRSQMHLKYLHYFGNESSESLLEAYGIIPKDQQSVDVLRPKQCPNCNEPNKPDSRFCAKCRMVLTYDAYSETLQNDKQKEDKINMMEQRFDAIQSQMQSLITTLGSMDEASKNTFAKHLFDSGIYKQLKSEEYPRD